MIKSREDGEHFFYLPSAFSRACGTSSASTTSSTSTGTASTTSTSTTSTTRTTRTRSPAPAVAQPDCGDSFRPGHDFESIQTSSGRRAGSRPVPWGSSLLAPPSFPIFSYFFIHFKEDKSKILTWILICVPHFLWSYFALSGSKALLWEH